MDEFTQDALANKAAREGNVEEYEAIMAAPLRQFFDEGTEVNGQIIEDEGWYRFIAGAWRWDEESQEG